MKIRRRSPIILAALAGVSALSLYVPLVHGGDASSPRATPMSDALAQRLRHLTLDDAIDIALHRNPDIQRQLQEIQRLQGVFIEMRAAALPHLLATGTFEAQDRRLLQSGGGSTLGTGLGTTSTFGSSGGGTINTSTSNSPLLKIPGTDQTSFGAASVVTTDAAGNPNATIPLKNIFGGSGGSSFNNKSYTIQVEVQQTIYNAAIPPAIRQARFLRDAAYYTLRETVDTTINTVKTDFYTVLYDKAAIDIANENLRLLQSQLTDQQNRFSAGTVPRFDVLQASVAVANQRPQVITATNNFALAYIGLARTLGIEYGPIQEKVAPLNLVGNLDYHPQNLSPEQGVAAGKRNRAILKQQQLSILGSVEQIRIAAAGYQPVLVADGGLESRSNSVQDDLGRTLTGWFYGANFNWNIFDGLATYGRVKQARASLREARITYLDTVNSVVEDIQNNYLAVQQSKELIASQVLNVSEAEEAVRLAQARLSAGAGTQLDVLQSQTSLLQAQTTELQARFNYAVALGNYERVTGTSTVYDEAFNDPLTNREHPTGVDSTGAAAPGKELPRGTIRTPDTVQRGTGRPLDRKINAENPDKAARENAAKPKKPVKDREYLLGD